MTWLGLGKWSQRWGMEISTEHYQIGHISATTDNSVLFVGETPSNSTEDGSPSCRGPIVVSHGHSVHWTHLSCLWRNGCCWNVWPSDNWPCPIVSSCNVAMYQTLVWISNNLLNLTSIRPSACLLPPFWSYHHRGVKPTIMSFLKFMPFGSPETFSSFIVQSNKYFVQKW